MTKPIYIIVEGISGSGKTTIAKRLAQTINGVYMKSLVSNSERGERLRGIRNNVQGTELDLLYLSDLLFDEIKVRDFLQKGISVVRDKTYVSSLAHLCAHEEIKTVVDEEARNMFKDLADISVVPDIVVYLDCTLEKIKELAEQKGDVSLQDKELWGSKERFQKQLTELENLIEINFKGKILRIDRQHGNLDEYIQVVLNEIQRIDRCRLLTLSSATPLGVIKPRQLHNSLEII